jgi:hypothetical protein
MRQTRRGLGAVFPAAFILSLVAAMATPALAMAATGGDSNRGDVWLDNVGQPAGPGHEMDPHLTCQDINLWGADMGDSVGTYTIDGWPPSGHMQQDYPASGKATWHYSGGKQPQVISVISVRTLIADAVANGDTPAHQGYHFKLQLSQDPQKHKTFWVKCPAPPSGGGGTTTPPTTTPPPTTTTPPPTTTTPPPTTTTPPTTTGTASGSIGGSNLEGSGVAAASANQPAGLAQTGEGIVMPIAAILLGLLLLLGGLSAFGRPISTRR